MQTKKSVVCFRCSQVGHVSKHCPQQKHRKGSERDDAHIVCSNGCGSTIDGKGRRRNPHLKKNTYPAVSRIAVCDSVSEEAEVIAVSFIASVDNACGSLERSPHRTGKKGATLGTNGIQVEDVVARSKSQMRENTWILILCCVYLACLPQKFG